MRMQHTAFPFFPNRMQLEQALEASRPDAPELLLDQEDPLLDW